ncbi:hypothetical protein [Streptomyces sp. NBC_00564]|uniref:hypothetical protein n=1 Tax=Streptomyces sp. NBC_00564 TaxID=2903663 RepID=UPI00352F367F|nr:hypothetical protein OG256_05855 [Streptomyces sp. NBC_00564]
MEGIAASRAYLSHSPNTDDADGILPLYSPEGTCAVSPADPTTSTCRVSFTVDALRDFDHNGLAGTWKVLGAAQDTNDDWAVPSTPRVDHGNGVPFPSSGSLRPERHRVSEHRCHSPSRDQARYDS